VADYDEIYSKYNELYEHMQAAVPGIQQNQERAEQADEEKARADAAAADAEVAWHEAELERHKCFVADQELAALRQCLGAALKGKADAEAAAEQTAAEREDLLRQAAAAAGVAEAAAKQAATEREDLLRRVMAKEAGAMSRSALTLENRGLGNRAEILQQEIGKLQAEIRLLKQQKRAPPHRTDAAVSPIAPRQRVLSPRHPFLTPSEARMAALGLSRAVRAARSAPQRLFRAPVEGGGAEGGGAEGGGADGGGVEVEGGGAEGGGAEGEGAEGRATEGGATEGGATEGGAAEGGAAEGGGAEGGGVEGGGAEGDDFNDDEVLVEETQESPAATERRQSFAPTGVYIPSSQPRGPPTQEIESPEGASTQLDPCCACETIWRKGGPCCWQHRIDGQPDPRRAQLGQQFREEHNVPEHQPWRPPSPTLPPPAEVLPPPRKQRAPYGKLHQRVLQGPPLIKGHIAEPRPQEGKGGHVVGAEIDRSLRRSRSVAPTRYSPPQEKTNNSRPASTASEHMRQSARARFHAVKSHVAECLVSAGLDAFKACPWAEGLEAVAIHHGHRAEWTTLFTQPQMVCGGPFTSGMVGGGHHTVLNMRQLAKIEDYSERAALIENVEMDHSLQPVIRTCRLWVQTVGLRGAQWFDNVSVDLLVHCIYSVRARTIKDKQYPPGVIPRCRSCHSTWHESHGTIVQLAEHTT
jgi:hypothetical protein